MDRDIHASTTISPEAQQVIEVLNKAKLYKRSFPNADADLEVWRQAQDAIVGLVGNNMMQGRELDRWGVGYFYYGISDVLLDGLNSLGGSFRDEKGAEAFYTVAVTPWLKATGDIQYVMPVNSARKDAVLVGARMKIEF